MKKAGNLLAALAPAPSWVTRAVPKGIARVPTHTVQTVDEKRAYMRANLTLPMRLRTVAGRLSETETPLQTTNVSSSGILFHCPEWIEPRTPVEVEVEVLSRPSGCGSVRMIASAQIVRAEAGPEPGWHSLALNFDDITFQRDEPLPSAHQQP